MQIGTNSNIIIVDIVAIPVHAAIVVHFGGIITIVARQPQPPQPDPRIKSLEKISRILFSSVLVALHPRI